jgi:hypothetical protein
VAPSTSPSAVWHGAGLQFVYAVGCIVHWGARAIRGLSDSDGWLLPGGVLCAAFFIAMARFRDPTVFGHLRCAQAAHATSI